MKRVFGWLLILALLSCSFTAGAENDMLVIAVLQESDAMNLPAEEAFFKQYPSAMIEYRLYTEEQLNTMLITGTKEFDMAILPYPTLFNMAKKGLLAPVNQSINQSTYPDQLIDLSGLLTIDDWVFALPMSIAQPFWIWNESIAAPAGVSYPEKAAWSWVDYAELANQFPKDVDGDGMVDTYLMYGSYLPAYPAFESVNLNMFTQYAAQHSDFDSFAEQYLELFREILVSDALMNIKEDTGSFCVLIQEASADNPLDILDGALVEELGGYRFLAPPLLDPENIRYAGSMSACAMMKNADRDDLAAAFLRAMISEDALHYGVFRQNNRLISRKPPKQMYFDENGDFAPVFMERDGRIAYRVAAGRDIPVISFIYSDDAFALSQDFREKLIIDTFLMGRDFYDAAWANFQEWYVGHLNNEQLTEAMAYLFGIARGQR